MTQPRALIAEDEPLLAQALQQTLAQAWPALQVLATVGDGISAVQRALELCPDVLFLDIRMPGQNGLEAAVELADAWPLDKPFPALVFVTAYDQYAVQAFEAQAADYLLKPVQPERLQKTVLKLQRSLARQAPSTSTLEASVAQLRQLLAAPGLAPPGAQPQAQPPLSVIQVGSSNQIQMVPLADVLYFEAADKYVRVLTAAHEYLIRTPLKELAARLDPLQFWQVHRGTLVRTSAIRSVLRDDSGRLHLLLHGRTEQLAVSRLYAQQFKAM